MSLSFSIALYHIAMTHKLLFQCNLKDDVDGIFWPSVSALNQTFRRIMSSHLVWCSESSLAVMEWYRVIGEENSKADACALKYVQPTSLKKERYAWDSLSRLVSPMLPGASVPPAIKDGYWKNVERKLPFPMPAKNDT